MKALMTFIRAVTGKRAIASYIAKIAGYAAL